MTWFKVDDRFHSHPKAAAVSLAAIGLWSVAGSWCGEHHTDGVIPDSMVSSLSRGQVELAKELADAGLWRRTKGGYRFHQWAADGDGSPRNPTKQEATAGRKKMSTAGALGNHRRWHAAKNKVVPGCRWCLSTGDGDRVPDPSGQTRPDGIPDGHPIADPMVTPMASGSGDTRSDLGNYRVPDRVDIGSPESPPIPPGPGPSLVVTRSDLSPSVSREDDDLDQKIVELIAELTGRTLSSEHAANIRRRLLDGRTVDRPWAYIAKSIRDSPVGFLPAPTLRLVHDQCPNPTHHEPLGADGTCVGCASERKGRVDDDSDARPVLARPVRPRMPRGPAQPPAQNETEAERAERERQLAALDELMAANTETA